MESTFRKASARCIACERLFSVQASSVTSGSEFSRAGRVNHDGRSQLADEIIRVIRLLQFFNSIMYNKRDIWAYGMGLSQIVKTMAQFD